MLLPARSRVVRIQAVAAAVAAVAAYGELGENCTTRGSDKRSFPPFTFTINNFHSPCRAKGHHRIYSQDDASYLPFRLQYALSWLRFSKFENNVTRAHKTMPLAPPPPEKFSPHRNHRTPATSPQPPAPRIWHIGVSRFSPETGGTDLGCECTNSTFTR